MKNSKRFFKVNEDAWDELYDQIKAETAPFYLFHEPLARHNINNLRQCLGHRVKLAYAMKANPWLCVAAGSEADYIEICSEGELEICSKRRIPVEKLMVDGVWQDEEFVIKALKAGVTRFGVDSIRQMEQLVRVAQGKRVRVLLRASSGNQFGMDQSELQHCIHLSKNGNVRIVGLQYFPGTLRSETRKVAKELECLRQWILECEKYQNLYIEEIEFGAGIGVPYFEKDKIDDYEDLIGVVRRFIQAFADRYQIIYEAGRIIAASCGIYVTEVFEEKWRGTKRILFCLGGTNHVHYPGGLLGIRTPHLRGICANPAGISVKSMICGSLCSASDILVHECSSLDTNLGIGDKLVFYEVGAYAPTESANLFLGMALSKVLVYNGEGICCMREAMATSSIIDDGM